MEIQDVEYLELVKNILSNEEFDRLKEIEHHGTTRFCHSLKVSYFSYQVSKVLHLDYQEVARAGLLHDFFLSDPDRTKKERFLSTFTHPKYAVLNACKYFDLTDKEKNIIESHMFPLYISLPKYAESWIVSSVDKVVGTYEFCQKFKHQISYATNFFFIVLLNTIR